MKKWDKYRIKRYPIHELYKGVTRYEYNPQYYDETAQKWRPFTILVEGKVLPRLCTTRVEAEARIEVRIIAEQRGQHESS